MDESRDYHTKWSKSDRERQIPCDVTDMWNLKYSTNQHTYKTEQTHRYIENRLVFAKEHERLGREGSRVGNSRGKLLYTGWINNKVLLYSIGNYIQHPIINHNGKEYKKVYIIYKVWITLNHFSVCIYSITSLYTRNWHIINQLYFNKNKYINKSLMVIIALFPGF